MAFRQLGKCTCAVPKPGGLGCGKSSRWGHGAAWHLLWITEWGARTQEQEHRFPLPTVPSDLSCHCHLGSKQTCVEGEACWSNLGNSGGGKARRQTWCWLKRQRRSERAAQRTIWLNCTWGWASNHYGEGQCNITPARPHSPLNQCP